MRFCTTMFYLMETVIISRTFYFYIIFLLSFNNIVEYSFTIIKIKKHAIEK